MYFYMQIEFVLWFKLVFLSHFGTPVLTYHFLRNVVFPLFLLHRNRTDEIQNANINNFFLYSLLLHCEPDSIWDAEWLYSVTFAKLLVVLSVTLMWKWFGEGNPRSQFIFSNIFHWIFHLVLATTCGFQAQMRRKYSKSFGRHAKCCMNCIKRRI